MDTGRETELIIKTEPSGQARTTIGPGVRWRFQTQEWPMPGRSGMPVPGLIWTRAAG